MSCRNAEEESAGRAVRVVREVRAVREVREVRAPDLTQAESAVAEIAKQRFDECCRQGDDKSRLTFFVAALSAAYAQGRAAVSSEAAPVKETHG